MTANRGVVVGVEGQPQIPFGNDNKKGNDNDNKKEKAAKLSAFEGGEAASKE